MTRNIFCNRLYDYRIKTGFSISLLSSLSGVDADIIAAIEYRNLVPSLKEALKLSSVLECFVEELFYFKEVDFV